MAMKAFFVGRHRRNGELVLIILGGLVTTGAYVLASLGRLMDQMWHAVREASSGAADTGAVLGYHGCGGAAAAKEPQSWHRDSTRPI